MPTILELLNKLGLNQKEANVYMACLELGSGTIKELSEKSGVKRTSIYNFLEELKQKGLITQIQKGKKTILILYKDSWKKTSGSKKNDITKQEFMDWTNGVWTFNGQSKKGAGGHPAPFPVELPKRCIKLFSFVGDVVLDPFMGSGSTIIASAIHDRKGIGVEIDEEYCNIAKKRIFEEAKLLNKKLLDITK